MSYSSLIVYSLPKEKKVISAEVFVAVIVVVKITHHVTLQKSEELHSPRSLQGERKRKWEIGISSSQDQQEPSKYDFFIRGAQIFKKFYPFRHLNSEQVVYFFVIILGEITTDTVTVVRGKMGHVLLMTMPLSENKCFFFF